MFLEVLEVVLEVRRAWILLRATMLAGLVVLGRGGAGARGEAREGREGMSARSGRESGRRARSRREHREQELESG